jgi:hypothetical protein
MTASHSGTVSSNEATLGTLRLGDLTVRRLGFGADHRARHLGSAVRPGSGDPLAAPCCRARHHVDRHRRFLRSRRQRGADCRSFGALSRSRDCDQGRPNTARAGRMASGRTASPSARCLRVEPQAPAHPIRSWRRGNRERSSHKFLRGYRRNAATVEMI